MVVPTTSDGPQLPRFYAGREVLVTGASGFMGKVLLERLLSQCPDVVRLHVLVRDKRGETPHKRLARLKQSQVFDKLRSHSPHQLDKLVVVAGDVTQPLLGVSHDDIQQLKQVSVVFHNAATIKFWEPLRDAVQHNCFSAVHLMDLCDKLPQLESLVHVSTAYSNCELSCVEERVYELSEAGAPLLNTIAALDDHTLDKLTPKLIAPKPNTYVFTKALAEVLVAERTNRTYSLAIFRPSIVISSHRSPFPGWIEGLSGATGVVVGCGQGVLRVFPIKGDGRADVLPVDIAIDNMIAVAWEIAIDKAVEARVYYCGSMENPVTWREIRAEMLRTGAIYPMDNVLYYPFTFGAENRYIYKLLETLLQTIPLYAAEYISKLFRIKQPISFIKVARKLSAMSYALGEMTCRDWSFATNNMSRLRDRLQHTDSHLFHLDIRQVNWQEHISNYHRGARKYLLRQGDETLPAARGRMERLRVVHRVVQLCLALFCLKLLLWMTNKLTSFT